MENKRKLIDLSGLSTFLSALKDFIKDYFDSRIDTELSSTSSNPLANSTITDRFSKVVWVGKEADVEAAIESGAIMPGFTQVVITDAEEESWTECTYADILALFPQYASL